jgi:hypothetical protein
MTIPTLLAAATSTVASGASTAAGASSSSPPKDWGWVLAVIGVGGVLVLFLLYSFYKKLQDSSFISDLLGLPSKENPTRQTPSASAFRFAEEFLARRTEFWLLYAQFFVTTFFIAAITALLLVGVIDVEAGLPALSTVVGIALGKTLLSTKGAPLAAQEQNLGRNPSNIKTPTITASATPAVVGTVLTADPGEWSGQLPMTYAYSWRRKGPGGETLIPDQNSATYTTVADDKGASISVMISASNGGGVSTATSDPVSISA